jgi:hypothetical protein
MGINATTGKGTASVIHQVIIKPATASTVAACADTENGLIKYSNMAITNPIMREKYLI